MAFDRGILKDETTTYQWDGVDNGNPVWNRDTSAADWMKNSVIWYSQRVTPQLGLTTINKYLADFKYGNEDTSGELMHFWLDSTLKISPDEERNWRNGGARPSRSKRALELTRKIIPETSSSGAVLSGKTGSAIFIGSNDYPGLGSSVM
jgi:beta-lactamase class D